MMYACAWSLIVTVSLKHNRGGGGDGGDGYCVSTQSTEKPARQPKENSPQMKALAERKRKKKKKTKTKTKE